MARKSNVNVVIPGSDATADDGIGRGDSSAGSADAISASGAIVIDPASIGDAAGGSDSGDTGAAPKRRGRKPGSTSTRSSKKSPSLDINGVEKILYSAHALLAGIAKTPELALDREEATELSKAIGAVSSHYDIQATQKSMDWANLLMVCGAVYGTRIFAIRIRMAEEKRVRREAMGFASPENAPAYDEQGVVEIPGVGRVNVGNLQ